jgi:two-component system nitrate/nitrite response regulator NarL
MHTATLLLVGSNKLSRACLKRLFTESPFTVIGEVSDIAMAEPGSFPDPDIVLVDIAGDSRTFLNALKRLGEMYPDTPVVVLNDKVCMATLAACLAAGVSGFLNKDISPDALLRSLQLVVLGETVFPTSLATLLVNNVRERKPQRAPAANPCGLSDREFETVQCLLRGESNKLIARRLSITEATIKVHMKSVMRKIKAGNRTQAAIWAHSHGCLPTHDAG